MALRRDATAVWLLRAFFAVPDQNWHWADYQRAIDLLRGKEVLRSLGLDAVQDSLSTSERRIDCRRLERTLNKLLAHFESMAQSPPERDELFFANAALLGRAFGLNRTEVELIALLVAMTVDSGLRSVFQWTIGLSRARVYPLLAHMLERPEAEVRAALAPDSFILASGFVWGGPSDMTLRCPSDVAGVMLCEHETAQQLLAEFFTSGPRPALLRADFPHLEAETDLVVRFLRRALEQRLTGVNVLLYGPSGSGKTELARLLADNAGAAAYEIALETREHHGMDAAVRLAAFSIAQLALRGKEGSLVLCDEADAVLSRTHQRSSAPETDTSPCTSVDKGELCRVLGRNPRPAIWVATDPSALDPSILRRFALSIHVDLPPRWVRRRIIARHLGTLGLDATLLERLSAQAALGPGLVVQTGRLARAAAADGPRATEQAVIEALRASLALQGRPPFSLDAPMDVPALVFELDTVNASVDLEWLARGLTHAASASVLLHGPSGTGKTAYARRLAQALGRDLVELRASDLVSSRLGETESSLASSFGRVDPARELLLLDDADALLRSREDARAAADVTMVNELLVQLEQFGGVVLCSASCLEDLDLAAFRRFDIKVRFDYPTPEQRFRLFQHAARELGLSLDHDSRVLAALERLPRLTPGDVVAALAKARLMECPPASASELVRLFAEECTRQTDLTTRRTVIDVSPECTLRALKRLGVDAPTLACDGK